VKIKISLTMTTDELGSLKLAHSIQQLHLASGEFGKYRNYKD
jgi:hypothetical protein